MLSCVQRLLKDIAPSAINRAISHLMITLPHTVPIVSLFGVTEIETMIFTYFLFGILFSLSPSTTINNVPSSPITTVAIDEPNTHKPQLCWHFDRYRPSRWPTKNPSQTL
uniref:Uncharacterized protein n=1 Tax=Anopheles darlingi TaxID=43151 RepID=A0A2M4CXE6_ANODA